MNIIARSLLYLGAKAAGPNVNVSYNLMDAALGKWFGQVSSTGMTVSEASMLSVSAAWCCCRILAETIGSLPWALYKRDKTGNATRDDMHPLSDVLLDSPNADMTSVEFRESTVLNLCQNGNAYAQIDRGGNSVVSLYPIPAANAMPKKDPNTGAIYYQVLDRGKWESYPQEKIWHVKGFGRDGLVGLSPIAAAREALGVALATEKFGALFFSQGGKPAGVISMPGYLKKDQRDIARENLNQMMGGLGNAHRFALFEGGMKPEPWGEMSLDDMQFILTRKFSIQEICRFYRIPPHMVADLERATFSNIEQQSLEFVQYTLMPYLTRIEASAARWLLSAKDRAEGYFLRFNVDGLLRADSDTRSKFLAAMLQNGVMTRNEVRAKENLNASDDEGMDDFTVQVNMTTIDNLDALEPITPAQPAAETLSTEKALSAFQEKLARLSGGDYLPFNAMDAASLKTLRQEMEEARMMMETLQATLAQMKSYAGKAERVDEQLRAMTEEVRRLRAIIDVSLHRVAEGDKAVVKELAVVRADVRKPRAPVFDAEGNVLGSEIVDKLG